MTSSSARSPSTARGTLLNLTLAIVGAILLIVTVRRVGWADVEASVMRVGWWFVPILALGGFRFAARSVAWMICAEKNEPALEGRTPADALTRRRRFSLSDAFTATIAGDALGNLTPLGLLASEPTKVLLVKRRLPVVTAVASVAAENAFYMGSVLLMIAGGALAFFSATRLPPALQVASQSILAGAILGGLLAVWIGRRRPAVLTRAARLIASVTGREATATDRLREIEVHFYALLTWPGGRIARVCLWEALFHVAAVAEVLLVLGVLPTGASTTLLDAFILETAGRLIVVVFKFVPYRLGVDEAGTALVARALMLDPTLGVTLALVRRLRILCWNAVGLAVLAARR